VHRRLDLRHSNPVDNRLLIQSMLRGSSVHCLHIDKMTQNGNAVMMGHTEDPKDGGAVAAAVFGAVAVYGVCQILAKAGYDLSG
jgi:hypothetical protein